LISDNQHYEFGIILMGASVVSYHILVSTRALIFAPTLLWLVVLYWRPFHLLLIKLSCSSKVVVSLQACG
jgi:hypothetical protein